MTATEVGTGLAEVIVHPSALRLLDEQFEAIAAWERPGCDIPPLVEAAVLATAGDMLRTPEQRQDAWERFQAAVLKRDALGQPDDKPWFEVYDEVALPPAGTHQEAAIQLACQELDDARRWLLTGRAR